MLEWSIQLKLPGERYYTEIARWEAARAPTARVIRRTLTTAIFQTYRQRYAGQRTYEGYLVFSCPNLQANEVRPLSDEIGGVESWHLGRVRTA
jgi:hypothetical protein